MKKTFFLLVLILGLYSCEKTLDLDQKFVKSKLVVNSLFSENEEWEVEVSRSLSVLDNAELNYITTAKVELFDSEDNLIEQLTPYSSGYISSAGNKPMAGSQYKLIVSAPDYLDVSSSDFCPTTVPILSADTSSITGDYGGLQKNIEIKFKDPVGENNYYAIEVEAVIPRQYWNSTKADYDTIYESQLVYLNSSNPVINNAGENLYTNKLTFKDALFDGQEKSINFNFNIYSPSLNPTNNKISVRLLSLSEASYNYFNSYSAYQEVEGNPFAEPVQVFTNVENGFGIFGGSSRYEIVFN